jgi:hypothetical protein
VNDRETWKLAVAAVSAEFAQLSPSRLELVGETAGLVKSCKQALHTIVERVASAGICASCGGDCCRTGKFHFTVVDLLVYLAGGRELFTPRFGQGCCPYLGAHGCLMEPAFRPFNCITFNCELVECLLDPRDKERLAAHEDMLRSHYQRFEELFGARFMGGLLMNWERDIVRDRTPILRGA